MPGHSAGLNCRPQRCHRRGTCGAMTRQISGHTASKQHTSATLTKVLRGSTNPAPTAAVCLIPVNMQGANRWTAEDHQACG